jgi:hypothetical protein
MRHGTQIIADPERNKHLSPGDDRRFVAWMAIIGVAMGVLRWWIIR